VFILGAGAATGASAVFCSVLSLHDAKASEAAMIKDVVLSSFMLVQDKECW
jgi:hypothetical protein